MRKLDETEKQELEFDYDNFKLIDMYSDYGDITGIQIIKRFIQHVNKHFGKMNESIIEFIRLYTDLTEIQDSFTAFISAWNEMVETHETFLQEVRDVLESWIDDPRVQSWITDRLDLMIRDEISRKLDVTSFDSYKLQVTSWLNDKADKTALTSGLALKANKADYDAYKISNNSEISKIKNRIGDLFISVKEFGAVGNKTTLDHVAIQSALDFAETQGGGIVYLPKGIYWIARTLRVGTNVTLRGSGSGSVLFAKEDSTYDREVDYRSAIVNKGFEVAGNYDGATNFTIENLAIDCDGYFQGILTNNATNFKIKNIEGIGTSGEHWLDINNSKNGKIENVNFIKGLNSVVQIDAQLFSGQQVAGVGCRNIVIDGITIENKSAMSLSTSAMYKRSAFHFHRGNSSDIFIKNVHLTNIECLLYKDEEIEFHNVVIDNVTMQGFVKPFEVLIGSSTPYSRNWKLSNMTFMGDSVLAPIGTLDGISVIRLEDFYISVETSSVQQPITYKWLEMIEFHNVALRGIYTSTRYNNLSFYMTVPKEKKFIEKAIVNQIEGKWTPKINMNGSYTRQEGWFIKDRNKVTVTGRIAINTITAGGGTLYVEGLPFEKHDDAEYRSGGSVFYIGGIDTKEPRAKYGVTSYVNKDSSGKTVIGFRLNLDDGMVTKPMVDSADFWAGFTITYFL